MNKNFAKEVQKKAPYPREFPDSSPIFRDIVKTIDKYATADIINISYFFDFELSHKSIDLALRESII